MDKKVKRVMEKFLISWKKKKLGKDGEIYPIDLEGSFS